jgi:hypothetical protein
MPINAKTTKNAKALRKAELLFAQRDAKKKQYAAVSAEKKAKSKELKAAKLAKKAELAQLSALDARAQAKRAHDVAVFAEELANKKVTEVKTSSEQFRAAEKQAKKYERIAKKKQMEIYKAARKSDTVYT